MHRRSTVELMMRAADSHDFLGVVHRIRHEVLTRIECVYNLLRLGKLNHRFLQVVQASLDQNFFLLVKVQQVVPQRLLAQHFWIADNDDTVLGACKCDVQSTGIIQETDALMLVGSHTSENDDVLKRDLWSD
jgi:hypothetical protein